MSDPVIPVNVQVPTVTSAPVIADLPVQALRVGYVARRALERLPEADWGVPGVYVLRSDDGSGRIYAGQAVHLRNRLLQHRAKLKLDWHQAVVIKRDTSHGFNSAEIGYLEGRLAAELGAIPGITLVEGLRSHDTTLPPHHMLALDALLPGILAALRLTGMDLFKDADLLDSGPGSGVKRAHTHIPGTVTELVAAGLLQAGAKLFLSQGGRTGTASISTSGELIVNGVAYASPSNAAARALGLQSSNGWTTWHVGDLRGPTLDQLRSRLHEQDEDS
ncbi:MAG: excinuclease ABC subunit C [Chloroflexi bacterium]|nr:excinuclease ABC subunit C [Chloroflexota bacterium]